MVSLASNLAVQIIIVACTGRRVGAAGVLLTGPVGWESEVVAEASRLLQCLSEHFVLADVIVGHGAAGELHCLFEVSLCDFRNRVVFVHLREAKER